MGKIAFIQRFSDQWTLNALYNTASHSHMVVVEEGVVEEGVEEELVVVVFWWRWR